MYGLMLQYPEDFYVIVLSNVALVTPYIYITTYKGLMQPSLWQMQPQVARVEIEQELSDAQALEQNRANEERPRYTKGLGREKVEEIAGRILVLMDQDKIYRASSLTLQDLAERLGASAHQTSQAINEGMDKNFYDLINGYRVEEAKRLLLDPKTKNHTIISVGLDAGFNSKTTFNTVFKKFTGYTPTDYKARHQSQPIPA
jgi:AraC-like DNA-binding protein